MNTHECSQRQRAWAYLSRCVEGPSRQLQAFLAEGRDVESIATGIRNRESWLGEVLKQTQTRYQVDRSLEDLRTVAALGGRLITPEDAEWPKEQFDQAFGFAAAGYSECARSAQEDAVPPHALWVVGGNLRELTAQAVSVVGTRAISSYGTQATELLVSGLVKHRWTIVSGGALGVDAVAHRTALANSGSTIAVAACGLDKTYPMAHRDLFAQIAQEGAVVSEYAPGISPARHRFLTRNRLVAALANGTVVVEAAWRSGALNTLTWAEGLGKVAMAVPGPVTHVNSLGCHDRIRSGRAQLVVSGDEVRELLSAVGSVDVEAQYELEFAANPVQALSRNELRIYDALSLDPQTAEDVAAEAGLSVALTVHVLVDLVKRGLVARNGVNWTRSPEEEG